MSATSNKSRILLLLMMVVALVFFISSFLAASINNVPPVTTGTSVQPMPYNDCVIVHSGEGRYYADCMFS